MLDFIKDNSILIVPNTQKNNIIENLRNINKNINVKIFSMEEFIKNITFTYDEKTIYELMKSENINYNIAKLYLNNMCYVENKTGIFKLDKLHEMKNNIDKYLIKNNLFNLLLKDKDIFVYGYDYISKYHKYLLNKLNNIIFIEKDYKNYEHTVYRFDTLENEIIFVSEKICELISSGIDINKIFLSNLDNNYYNIIKKIFKMYNIPINLNEKHSLYTTEIGKYFINNLDNNIEDLLNDINNKFVMENIKNKTIFNKLINVINEFYFTNDYLSVKENIINVMKNTYLDNKKYKNAINEIDLLNSNIKDDEYVFLVGFNLNSIPKTKKDEDYITDNIKPNYMDKSYVENIINKEVYYKVISNIKNLTITYKEKYLNESFYPSLLIDEYKMNVMDDDIKVSKYSNEINKTFFAKSIDNLIKFNIKDNNLSILNNNYKIDYMTYNNKFSGINKDSLYKYLNNSFNLSYSSMDNYYHCAFKFYLSNILKLDYFEETIQIYIGNLFHYVLSKAFVDNFDFNSCVNHYINNNPYPVSAKSSFFLDKIIDELKFIVDTIKYQNTLTDMKDALYEQIIIVEKPGIININFKGFIDKLLMKDKNVVIIDYKTYMVDINLNYLPYGLSMQLPVYLYLTKNYIKDAEIVGFYLQQILFNKFNKDKNKTLKELKYNNSKLKGYSIGNENKLSVFDSTYVNSELIHSMKVTNKGFGTYSKVLTEKQIDNIVKLTDDKINECCDAIIHAKFHINSKRINNKNIGCEYCKFRDICFVTNKDYVDLEDIKDMSFLD